MMFIKIDNVLYNADDIHSIVMKEGDSETLSPGKMISATINFCAKEQFPPMKIGWGLDIARDLSVLTNKIFPAPPNWKVVIPYIGKTAEESYFDIRDILAFACAYDSGEYMRPLCYESFDLDRPFAVINPEGVVEIDFGDRFESLAAYKKWAQINLADDK